MKKRRFDIFTIIVIAVIGYFIYVVVNQQIYMSNIAAEQASIEKHLEEEQAENQRLKEKKQALYDPDYIETIAREELGMTKKDEIPYVPSK